MEATKTNDLTNLQLVQSLHSTKCISCGRRKKMRQTMCGTCYYNLSNVQRTALYNRVNAGYREAVIDALETLKVTEPKLG